MDDIRRNGSKYYDPTAYKAMKNYIERVEKNMEIYKGDIVEIELNNGNTREAVIISSHSRFSTILMLTDNETLPYSVNCKGMKYTDPAMLQYVFNDNVKELIRSMKQDEFEDLLQAVVDGLGYEAPVKEVVKEVTVPVAAPEVPVSEELTKAQAERDVYKSLYENLLNSMMAR